MGKDSNQFDEKDPSEGEQFIAEYLDWLGINYKREYKI